MNIYEINLIAQNCYVYWGWYLSENWPFKLDSEKINAFPGKNRLENIEL